MKPGMIAAIVVAILMATGLIAFFVSGSSTDDVPETNQQQSTQSSDTNDTEDKSDDDKDSDSSDDEATTQPVLTTATVAQHSGADDCWTIIDGSVYDITIYIPRHPGGDEILRACGTDGTSLFEQRTTADGETVGSGTSHSGGAASQLSSFLLGPLTN